MKLRIPSEWEPQAAVWMQWPGRYEVALRTDFASIIKIAQRYQPVRILVSTEREKENAVKLLAKQGGSEKNLYWHVVPVDNAWMRDSGPVYVSDGSSLMVLNWKFTGWDGSSGAFTKYDNAVPDKVAAILGLDTQSLQSYVLEKGNLEVNGGGVALMNLDCQNQRNPGLSQAAHEEVLKPVLGLKEIIWAHGHHPEDLTTGHIDGIARFVSKRDVIISDTEDEIELEFAESVKKAGFNTHWYPGDVNWFVGNGFVAAISEGNVSGDAQLEKLLAGYYPGRDIHLINVDHIVEGGGGIHCVTNDQPAVS